MSLFKKKMQPVKSDFGDFEPPKEPKSVNNPIKRTLINTVVALLFAAGYFYVDLPPINIVSDALAISQYIDGIIVVIREDYTEKKELERCFRQLEMANVNILGCVMNEAKGEGGNYGKYKYRKYGKYSRYYSRYYSRDRYYTHENDNDK